MKSLSILLIFNALITIHVVAQTPSGVTPATKPASTTTTKPKTQPTTKPASVSSTAGSRPAARPPATSAAPKTAASPNRQQELYDQYHGVTKKPSPPVTPAPSAPAERPASRPTTAVATSSPAIQQPVTPDGSPSGFGIGVRGGVTYLVYFEEVTGIKPSVGFVGGLFANIGKGTFSFQPELNYARYMFNVQSTSGPSGIGGNIDQFEIPLLLKISTGPVNTNRFFLNIGPYGAYVSSASINGQKISLADVTNRFRFGAAAGVGAALKTGPGHLTLELRGMYELGDSEAGFKADSRTIYPQLTIGYVIPLGGR